MFPSAPIRLSRVATGVSALALAFAGLPAFGQATYDVQVPFNLSKLATSLASPRGVAVATDGTVYVADFTTATSGRVIRIISTGNVGGTSGGTGSLTVTTATKLAVVVGGKTIALKEPNAVAVDLAGDLYIADIQAGKVYELTAPETSSTATELTYAGTGPTALATDASDNLYVADSNGNIYKFVGGAAVGTALTIGSTAYAPVGLAVNGAGDVFFASAAQNQLYEYSPAMNATTVYLSAPSTGTFEFSSATPGLPIGMGFDPAGNLYVLDSASTYLWQIDSATPTTNYQVPFSANTTTPGSLTVSSVGNLLITDDTDATVNGVAVTPSVAKMFYNKNFVNLGTILAGVASPLLNANFNFYSSDTSIAFYQTIMGDSTGEFSFPTSTGACNGDVGICNLQVEVTYQESTPGLRLGAAGYIDDANNIFAVHVAGTSGAARAALYPGRQSILSTVSSQTLYEPQGTAVSGDGKTFFIADEGGINLNSTNPTNPYPAVYAYTVANGVPSGTPTTVGRFRTPVAVTLDAFGNLYVADYSGYVSQVPPTYNPSTGTTTWSGSGQRLHLRGAAALTHPMSLTVDIHDNLWIGDMGSGGVNATSTNPGYIVRVPLDGGAATRYNYVIGGIPVIFPDGLTTDSFGNLFIADGGDGVVSNGSVDVVPMPTGQPFTVDIGNFSALNEPTSVALDAANDLYVLDSYNERILTIPFLYSGSVPVANSSGITLLGGPNGNSGLTAPYTGTSLVVWPSQNTLTVTDIGYQPAPGSGGAPAYPVQVLTLASQNTAVTIPSGNTSVALTGINVGNESITFTKPDNTDTDNFSLSDCGSASTTLASGVTNACTTTITYTPNGGAPQTAVFTLNADAAKDGSALGNQITATGTPQTPNIDILGSGAQGNSSSSVLVENIGGGNLTISGISVTGEATLTDLGTCSTSTSLTYGQSCSVTFTFAAETGTAKQTATVSIISNSDGTGSGTANVTYKP